MSKNMAKNIMEGQYEEILRLTDILKRLVDSYRLLIGGAAELNSIYPRKKSDVEEALERVDELGEIIDKIIKVIHVYDDQYLEYSKVKHKIVGINYEKKKMEEEVKNVILTEVENDLNFQNSNVGRGEEN